MEWKIVRVGLNPVRRSHYRALWLPGLDSNLRFSTE
jgi:hypothetical protein